MARSKNAFTSMSASEPADRHSSDLRRSYQKEKQPQLTLFLSLPFFLSFFLPNSKHRLFRIRNNDCQTAESVGLDCRAQCRCDPVTRLHSYNVVLLVQGCAGPFGVEE